MTFQAGGQRLWDSITEANELDAGQLVQLEEACRAKDRCDLLDSLLAEAHDSALLKDANATANLMKQLLAALRLPDPQSGKRPQFRGPRGAQKPTVPGGKVSSLDRARSAKTG
jgi:hypothetical protein